MNGLFALAMGKVVLGGAEEIGLKSLGVTSSPVINVEPSKEKIIGAVEKLLDNKKYILELGLEGRKYVEDIHCHIKVAQKFIKTWEHEG